MFALLSVSGYFTLFLGYADSWSVLVLGSRHLLLLGLKHTIYRRSDVNIYRMISAAMTKTTRHFL